MPDDPPASNSPNPPQPPAPPAGEAPTASIVATHHAPPQPREPGNAAGAGIVANPEVIAVPPPVLPPPPAPPVAAPASPWARPAVVAPQLGWDASGYAPPPAVRIDAGTAAIPYPGSHPLPPPVGQAAGVQAGVITHAPAMATNAVVAAASASSSGRRSKVQLRTSASILLFLVGLAIGVVGLRLATPTHAGALDNFPALDRTAVEPIPASAVAKELAQNDVHGLAQLLDSDTLTSIQTQLKPFVTFESVTFVGATSHDHDTIAGYVVRGRDASGNLGLVGLVIRLRDGQVVAQ